MGMKYLLKMQSRDDPPIWGPFVHLYFIYLWVYFFPYGIFPFNSQYVFFSFLKCSFLLLSPSSKCVTLSSFSITKQNFPEQHRWKPSYMPYTYLISSKVRFFFFSSLMLLISSFSMTQFICHCNSSRVHLPHSFVKIFIL